MTKEQRFGVRLEPELRQKIEQFIKKEYPRYKTYSEVVREALKRFLEGEQHGDIND